MTADMINGVIVVGLRSLDGHRFGLRKCLVTPIPLTMLCMILCMKCKFDYCPYMSLTVVPQGYVKQLDQQCRGDSSISVLLFFDLAIASSKHWPVSLDDPVSR